MKQLIFLALAVVISGCSTTAYTLGGSKLDGVVEIVYVFHGLGPVNTDLIEAQSIATKRCSEWGRDSAKLLTKPKEQNRTQCSGGGGCKRWEVIVKYQCVDEK